MKVLVTGCNGRLGSAVCETLLAAGHVVVGIDASPAPDRPHRVLIDSLLNPFSFHRGLDLLAGHADAVVHLANHTNSLVAPPEVVLRENGAMNASVFLGAWQAGVPRVVFASSIQAMLGGVEPDGSPNQRPPVRLPISESLECRPTNVYGLSKVLAERSLDALCSRREFGRAFSAVSLRLPYIMPSKGLEHLISRPASQADFMWGGSEGYAYIAREDAAEAVRLAVEAQADGHRVLWCSAPDPRVNETVASLIDRFYSQVPGADACRAADSLVDCSVARTLLGWAPARVIRDERARRGVGPSPTART